MNSNYGLGLPVAASSYARDVDRGIYLLHGSMVAIFVLWAAFYVYLLVRYHARPGVPADPRPGKRWWLVVPLVLVFTDEIVMIFHYAIPTWKKIVMDLPDFRRANVVEVTAEQFAWNVQYPGLDGRFGRRDPKFIDSSNVLGLDPDDPMGKDDVVTLNEIHLPLGRPTIAYLTAKDVIHSFFIPEFRVKKDCVPGMKSPIWVEPIREGRYELACSQLCGIGHSNMRGDVIVERREDFELWIKSQTKGKG